MTGTNLCVMSKNGKDRDCSKCENYGCSVRRKSVQGKAQILEDYNNKAYINNDNVLCIDIGTTTVVFAYLEKNKSVKTCSLVNPQIEYGADVLSRINAANNGYDKIMHQQIYDALITGTQKLCGDAKIDRAIISANTTMVHLLMQYPCSSLGVYPFTVHNINTIHTTFNSITLSQLNDFPVIVTGGISAFVGGDIVNGILFCEMDKKKDISLFIDLGTNGEMAIGNKDKILCTSTAAGPAFEGGKISCGVACVEGAVYSVKDNTIKTIGDKAPIGICGSGIVDLAAKLIGENIIDKTGLLDDKYFDNGYKLCENVILTQSDIRQIQMAKAAIATGIDTLIENYGSNYGDIKNVYLAGGFGNGIDVLSAVQLGIIPPSLADRVVSVGNASLGGAIEYAMNCADIERIRQISSEIVLGNDDVFGEKYIENMNF